MRSLSLTSYDPYFNLAVEEYLLKNSIEDYFILAINFPSVILGKHQSPHREVNTEFITKKNIPVIRRITGGGTVFHDMGNLNFTFITNCEPGRQVDFRRYTKPVIDFLATLDVHATFEGKSDLKVNGFKISGNAEHVHRNRVLHHGTLLFSSDMDMLRNTLRKDTSCYKTRAVESNPSSVSNLNIFIPDIRDINEFRQVMEQYFLKEIPGIDKYFLSDHEAKEIDSLADSKYRKWEWNFAYGPDYQFVKQFNYQEHTIECRLTVREGIIRECTLGGHPDLESLSGKLTGLRHIVEDMKDVLGNEKTGNINIYNFF